MTEDTNPHNGTVQGADFGLIHPAKWQNYHIATKELISHEATKGHLTRDITTRPLQKELGNLISN